MTGPKKQNPPDPAYRASGEAHAGPSFSLGNRLGRLCWGLVQATLFRWSPRPFHGWRRFLLRLFGAKIARSCHIYPGAVIGAELSGSRRHLLLRDSDQMSMAVALELRVPFLVHDLVNDVLPLPASTKQPGDRPKPLLVKATADLLPNSVYDRPKEGFVLPMAEWMRGPLAAFVSGGLSGLKGAGLMEPRSVADSETAFNSGRLHWTRLWELVVLGHFLRRR